MGGTDDSWTPISQCLRVSAEVEGVTVHPIEGATHAFDTFSWRGEHIPGGYSAHGHYMEPNLKAVQRFCESPT